MRLPIMSFDPKNLPRCKEHEVLSGYWILLECHNEIVCAYCYDPDTLRKCAKCRGGMCESCVADGLYPLCGKCK